MQLWRSVEKQFRAGNGDGGRAVERGTKGLFKGFF